MNATTDIARFLFRCRQCGKAQRREYPRQVVTSRAEYGGEYTQTLYLIDGDWKTGKPDAFICCGVSGHGAEVKGTLSDAPCDARCKEATGPVCQCQCAGANHGTSHYWRGQQAAEGEGK